MRLHTEKANIATTSWDTVNGCPQSGCLGDTPSKIIRELPATARDQQTGWISTPQAIPLIRPLPTPDLRARPTMAHHITRDVRNPLRTATARTSLNRRVSSGPGGPPPRLD